MLRVAGLEGRSFVPLLTAHACAVPAIQSARIIRDPGQRLRTILVLPLMTCSARIPTYGLLVATLLRRPQRLVQGCRLRRAVLRGSRVGLVAVAGAGAHGEASGALVPLVLEMPRLPRPQARVVARVGSWRRGALRERRGLGHPRRLGRAVGAADGARAGQRRRRGGSAPPDASPRVVAMHGSVAAFVGRSLEPVTRPAGFDWRINVGLIGSFGARELMVGTLGVIFGIEGGETTPPPLVAAAARREDDAR